MGKVFIGLLVALFVYISIAVMNSPQNSRDDSIQFASFVKGMMKDPKSFDVVELRRTNIGATCLTFRATNSFGGFIQSHAVKTRDNKIQIDGVPGTEQFLWGAYCGSGAGDKITVFNFSL